MKESIVYIAGYGRSGSTLLEKIICNNNEFIGIGEAVNFDFDLKNKRCNCGEILSECEVWSRFFSKTCQEDIDINLFFNKLFQLKKHIVDSSKTAGLNGVKRPFNIDLNRHNMKVIHLFRDPRACLWSNIKGSNRKIEAGYRGSKAKKNLVFLRTTVTWLYSNIVAMKLKKKVGEDNYMILNYDDLISNNETVLNNLSNFLEADLTNSVKELKEGKVGRNNHQFSGNRMRKNNYIKLRKDQEWEIKLNPLLKKINGLITLPLHNYMVKASSEYLRNIKY